MTTLTTEGYVNGSGTTNFAATHDYTAPTPGSPLDALGKTLDGNFVAVERDDDLFIGTCEVTAQGEVIIRSGNQGRPAVLLLDDVDAYRVLHAETFRGGDVDLIPAYSEVA